MFQLLPDEAANLRSQIVISSWGGRRTPPYAFTEQGVTMLSSVLHSERAAQVNVEIMRLRTLVAFYVEQHNTQMPHAAFSGQTPDEMYFGNAANLPAELAAARKLARAARLATNRGLSCERCRTDQVITPESNIPP